MTDEDQSSPFVTVDDGCQFPAGLDGHVCGEPIARSGAPGRPSRYCDNPEHTRAKAFSARRALVERGHGGHALVVDVAVPERPVSDGRASFGALLIRFEESAAQAQLAAAEHQAQLAAILERATAVVRTVSDPDAAGYEVEQIQRETAVRVAEAQTAQATAERDARDARRKADTEVELRAQADEAAGEALEELAAVRTESAEMIARIAADADTTIAEHQHQAEAAAAAERAARSELDQVRAEAAQTVAEAQAAAEQHKSETLAEAERVLAERAADMRRQIEQAKADASAAEGAAQALVKAAQHEVAEANTAVIRAQADQAASDRRADEDRAALQRLRDELEQQRSDHHQELVELRTEIRQERDDMRRERAIHAEQLAAVLATVPVQVPADHVEPAAPAQPRRRAKQPVGAEPPTPTPGL